MIVSIAVLLMGLSCMTAIPLSIIEIDAELEEMDTFVTTGIHLKKVEDSVVYTDEYLVTFVLPDLPEITFPNRFPIGCNLSLPSFKLLSEVIEVNLQTLSVLNTASEMFTLEGVSERPNTPMITAGITKEDLILIEKEGVDMDWYKKVKSEFYNRKAFNKESSLPLQPRSVIGKSTLLSRSRRNPLMGALWHGARRFFFNKGTLLKALSFTRARLPSRLKPLTDIAGFVSNLAFNKNSAASNTNIFESDISAAMVDGLSYLRDGIPNTQFKITQLAINQNSVLVQRLTDLHLMHTSMTTCRDGLIPLGFLPPNALVHRLQQLKSSIAKSSDIALVFPPSEPSVYYNWKLAKCKFDNDGGLLGVKILLRPQKSTYELFELKSFGFAWKNYTCDQGIDSGLLVRDMETGSLYPITQLDEDDCHKDDITICKLPQVANSDLPRHFCLITALGGGNSEQIADACPLSCRKGTRVSYTHLDQDTLVVAHLPRTGANVICDNGYVEQIVHHYDVGALKLTLGCGCQLVLKSRVIAKSQRTVCDVSLQNLIVRHILPIQMSLINKDWVPLHDGDLLETRFTSRDVVDEAWQPEVKEYKTTSDVWYTTQLPVWLLPGNILAVTTFLFVTYKHRTLQIKVATLIAMSNIQGANSARSDVVVCKIPEDVYAILCAIVALQVIVVGCFMYQLVASKVQTLHKAYIQQEIKKAVANGNIEGIAAE